MNFFEERIIKDGVVKTDTILKVDSFLNHRIDTALLDRIGEEFKRRFDGKRINKILTIEASGIGIACITALHFGVPMVDFSGFDGVSIFSLPKVLPVSLEFKPDAIIAFILIFLVSATETIGDTSAIAASGLGRTVKEKEISGSIACDGIVSSLSSLIGCMPITSFSQNVGLVAMTKVVNRIAIASGAAIMILAGLFPVFGALIATLPSSVLGGCTIIMFANIIVSGLDMFRRCGLTKRNLVVLAFSLSFGLRFTQVPGIFDVFPEIVKTVFAENCVAIVFVAAIILDRVLPAEKDVV